MTAADLSSVLGIGFQAIGAVGVAGAIYFAYSSKRASETSARIGEENRERIQQLDVRVDGRLTQLLDTLGKEQFSAGVLKEREDTHARAADKTAAEAATLAATAEATAKPLAVAAEKAAETLATAADAAATKAGS